MLCQWCQASVLVRLSEPPLLLQHSLLLTLEEMYHGCVKKVTHERQVVKADGTSATEQRELSIDVSFLPPHCVKLS